MDQNSGFDQEAGRGPASASAQVDIPVLKQKKDERKGAGIPLGGAPGAGGAIVPAGAGLGSAAGGGLKALLAGKAALAAIVLGAGGLGLVGFGVWQQGRSARTAAPEAMNLGALPAMVRSAKRDAQGSRSLAFMAKAGQGELRWEEANAAQKAAPEAAAETKDAAAKEEKAAGVPNADELLEEAAAGAKGAQEQEGKGKMGALASSKLSTQLGQSQAFGGKSIFNGGTGFNVKSMGAAPGSRTMKPGMDGRGRLDKGPRGTQSHMAKKINTRGITANRAMGQAKFAQNRSHAAANLGSSEGGSNYAAQAFDQSTTRPAEASNVVASDFPEVQPPGAGAPDPTAGAGGGGTNFGNCPDGYVPTADGGCQVGNNVTPYQGQVNAAEDMTGQALILAIIGMALIIAGAAMGGWGWLLVAVGVALVVMSTMMASQASSMGDGIAQNYGQQEQGAIVDQNADAASAGQSCQGANCRLRDHDNTVGNDVQQERDATYSGGDTP